MKMGFVALRQNKPAFSGRWAVVGLAGLLRRFTRRYLSQRDKFHHTAGGIRAGRLQLL
jgi:hypothetical protein